MAWAIGFLAVFLPSLAWVLLSPPMYEAELRLLVQRERPESRVQGSAGSVTAQEVRSEIELLKSRELLEQVVRRRGLAEPGGEPQAVQVAKAVRRLEEQIDIGAVPKANLISLRYEGRNPSQAAGVLNELAALYLEKRAALSRHGESLQFFQQQAAFEAAQVEAAQKAMAEFTTSHQLSLLNQQKAGALRRSEDLEKELEALTGELQSARQRLEALRNQGAKLPATIKTASHSARNQALIEKLKTRLLDLENQRTELLTRYEPDYRLIAEVEQKIADTRTALNDEQRTTVVDETESLNPIRQSVEAEYFRTETELRGLEARYQALRQRIAEQHEHQLELEDLTADYDTLARKLHLAEENYLRYEKRKEDSRIANALDLEQLLSVSIVEPAKEPALPAERSSAMLVLVSLLVASCTGVGAAVVRDRQTRAVAGASEIADMTGLPVLSTATQLTRRREDL